MKKLIALILALMLPLCASAATVTASHTARDIVYLGAASNTYVVGLSNGYQIFAADGTAIGPVWGNMGPKQNGAYYQVLNNGAYSVVNAQGDLVLPEDYFGFVTAGESWLLGIVMEQTTDANADYTSKSGAKMNVVRAEVVVDGKPAGTLNRSQYAISATAGVVGDYLYLMHENGRTLFFDKALNQTAEVYLTEKPAEYMVVDGKYIHTPTQQAAFCAESTLTAEQVSQPAMVLDGRLVNLRGETLAELPAQNLYTAKIRGDYLFLETAAGRGLWNMQGKEIIPCTYYQVGDAISDSPFFLSGYQAALTAEGDLFFFDTTGAVTAAVTGQKLNFRYCYGYLQGMPILAYQTAEGYTLISATHGVLPGVYEDFDYNQSGVQVISVCRNGLWGCIGLDGTTVVPFEHKMISMSDDGTLIMGQKPDGSWNVYNIAY